MTEEKRKRGRPKKVKLNEYGVPDNPQSKETGRTVTLETATGEVKVYKANQLSEAEIIVLAEAAKGNGIPTAHDTAKFDVTLVDEFRPSKMKAVVSIMEDVALAKKHIERLKKKPEYSPYDNPRFKSKNNLK